MAEINYYLGMSDGMFTQSFLDKFDRLPRPSENETRQKQAESHVDEIMKSVTKRADIHYESVGNNSA